MQIKIIIIGVLVSCSYLIGDFISKIYTTRHKEVNEIIRILENIRSDISFGLYTLNEVFNRIGNKKDFLLSNFFRCISYDLTKNTDKTLEEVILFNIKNLQKESYLNDKDIEELKEVLISLGKSDVSSQQRVIDLSIENFKKTTLETKEDIEKKGVVYKKLSTIIGVMIGIILI